MIDENVVHEIMYRKLNEYTNGKPDYNGINALKLINDIWDEITSKITSNFISNKTNFDVPDCCKHCKNYVPGKPMNCNCALPALERFK